LNQGAFSKLIKATAGAKNPTEPPQTAVGRISDMLCKVAKSNCFFSLVLLTESASDGAGMLKFLQIILMATLSLAVPISSSAQDFSSMFRNFNAQELTQADKRFLQAALAFEGQYNGLLDGKWGRISQSALDRYSWREFGSSSEEWHMVILALSLFERIDRDGWRQRYFPALGMSFLFPEESFVTDPSSDNLVNWRHANSSLAMSVGTHSPERAQALHDFTIGWHDAPNPVYTVRKNHFAVTGAKKRDGSRLYTRSNFVDGYWSTVMLSAKAPDEGILNAVAASISIGQADQLFFTTNGRLDFAIKTVIAAVDKEDNKREASMPPEGNSGENKRRTGSGSGFIVSIEGHILTNEHVVQGCTSIFVDGEAAKVIASDKDFDLALLHAPASTEDSVAVFSASSAKLNSDVTVIGYPYGGALGGLNVTRGSVSALTGLRGDGKTMQITAPIQTGNSGGPIVGPDGEVVGVVVSKLDALQVADAVGDLPQNVNYGVRGEIAKLFLAQNGVDPALSLDDVILSPVELAEKAASFTVYVECK
jgi:S1-C subfamily serine protease